MKEHQWLLLEGGKFKLTMANEIAIAMREEVQLFLKGTVPGTHDEEVVLMELANSCASRTIEILISKGMINIDGPD